MTGAGRGAPGLEPEALVSEALTTRLGVLRAEIPDPARLRRQTL